MWKLLPVIWVLSGAAGVYGIMTGVMVWNDREAARCQAVRQTILDEAELIAAGGKFPGEEITSRWKSLIDECQ